MSAEEKQKIYSKVSSSLTEYYNSDIGKQEYTIRKQHNIETNKKTSAKWRAEFKMIFGVTPESFRKYNKLQQSLDLFKEIRNKTVEEQINEVNRFMETINS